MADHTIFGGTSSDAVLPKKTEENREIQSARSRRSDGKTSCYGLVACYDARARNAIERVKVTRSHWKGDVFYVVMFKKLSAST